MNTPLSNNIPPISEETRNPGKQKPKPKTQDNNVTKGGKTKTTLPTRHC